jgi:two-component system, OmpR family, phosphate regulon sensor histidine kinase PhoR
MPDAQVTSVLEAITLPAMLANREAQLVAINKAAKLQFGDMPHGTTLHLRFRQPEIRSAFANVLANGAPVHFEYHERVPIERWFRVDVSATVGTNAGVTGFLIVFRDTSESRNIERMRTDFVANASHELRTPLASLSGFIETLKGPARNDEKAREHFLNIMQDQASRMARLIDDLLSLSRLEMRPYADLVDTIDLKALARQVIDTLKPVATANAVEIIANLLDADFTVSGIRDELIEVTENLIENACKYGRSGKKVEVTLKNGTGTDEGFIQLCVKDYGQGISADHVPRLTERFYRADSGNDPSQKGTGLGLSIVKHIVSRHQGRLSITSTPGEGSSFVVFLPRTRVV